MSIWVSIGGKDSGLDRIPDRDPYDGTVDESEPCKMVGVAASPTFNDMVRLTISTEKLPGGETVYLKPDEARKLIELLQQAVDWTVAANARV